MDIAIYTLGCKANQYETQAMETELVRRGHRLVDFDGPADAYIVNTCAVTAASGHKSRQAIRRCKKHNPAALVAVCGCYAQIEPEEVAALEVDLVSGPDRRMAFLDDLEALTRQKASPMGGGGICEANDEGGAPAAPCPAPCDGVPSPKVTVGDIMKVRTFEQLPAGGLSGRTRAMLKVEDGCTNFCSYCVIPYARGPIRSLPLEKAREEAARLMAEGYKELVLTGIEISSWGQEWKDGLTLTDLVEAICAAAPACRIRLGSLEPRTVTEDFCQRLSGLHNLCPHFHLSLQSGCDATLKRMNRKYDTARYLESVRLLRQYFDRPGITTDLIVGFPGETEEEFTSTLAFLEECAFSAVHIFPYSKRPGTPAATMPNQVPKTEKESRAHRAAQVMETLRQQYLQSWVGQTLPVLFEEEKAGAWRGYAPNYVEVKVSSTGSLHNIKKAVTVTGVSGTSLLGEI